MESHWRKRLAHRSHKPTTYKDLRASKADVEQNNELKCNEATKVSFNEIKKFQDELEYVTVIVLVLSINLFPDHRLSFPVLGSYTFSFPAFPSSRDGSAPIHSPNPFHRGSCVLCFDLSTIYLFSHCFAVDFN